jgi:hypothetical protein
MADGHAEVVTVTVWVTVSGDFTAVFEIDSFNAIDAKTIVRRMNTLSNTVLMFKDSLPSSEI